MATRRIARGRGASPVPIIILSVIVVALLGSTIVLALKVGDIDLARQKADARIKQLEGKSKEDLDYFRKYQVLVGLEYEAARAQFENLKNDLKKKGPLPIPPPEGGAGTPASFDDMRTLLEAYADRCVALDSAVARLEQELAEAKNQREQAVQNGEESVKAKEAEIGKEKGVSAGLRKEKADVEAELAKTRTDLNNQIEALKGEKTNLVKQANDLEKGLKVAQEQIKKDKELITDLKFPKKTTSPLVERVGGEPVDGKVLTVDADGQYVMVDVGRRDWVEVGMIFSVYDNTNPESRSEKGKVQIGRVYDEIARAKVLKQDEIDPILPGMVIINPAFKRHRKLEFVLEGNFREPRIEQLLTRYPCSLAKTVSRTTDYVIIGEGRYPEGATLPEDSDNVLTAREMKIVVMKERELLHYLGELD